MSKLRDTPLARELSALLRAKGLSRKRASIGAGLGETYIRDLLVEGRSGGPQMVKLAQLEQFLGVPSGHLSSLAGASSASQIVEDPQELVLLRTFRELSDEGKQGVINFAVFHHRQERSAAGEAV